MTAFIRFPHTPHIEWLGEGVPRDDKVMSAAEVKDLLESQVVIEEKLDGANLGFSISSDGGLRAQNRGQYLHEPYGGQFRKLDVWQRKHEDALFDTMCDGLILFGEWCAAKHSIRYDQLPDWLLVFDVYDRNTLKFWSTMRRNKLAVSIGLSIVPMVYRGQITLEKLERLVRSHPSAYRAGSIEGVVIRQESDEWLETRAKLVHPDFTQAIGDHWSKRRIEWNRLLGNTAS